MKIPVCSLHNWMLAVNTAVSLDMESNVKPLHHWLCFTSEYSKCSRCFLNKWKVLSRSWRALRLLFSGPQACIQWTSQSTRAFAAPLRDWPWMTQVSQCRETAVWPWGQAGGENDCWEILYNGNDFKSTTDFWVITYAVAVNKNKSVDIKSWCLDVFQVFCFCRKFNHFPKRLTNEGEVAKCIFFSH